MPVGRTEVSTPSMPATATASRPTASMMPIPPAAITVSGR
jgi:hypothetical protein